MNSYLIIIIFLKLSATQKSVAVNKSPFKKIIKKNPKRVGPSRRIRIFILRFFEIPCETDWTRLVANSYPICPVSHRHPPLPFSSSVLTTNGKVLFSLFKISFQISPKSPDQIKAKPRCGQHRVWLRAARPARARRAGPSWAASAAAPPASPTAASSPSPSSSHGSFAISPPPWWRNSLVRNPSISLQSNLISSLHPRAI